MRDDNTLLAGVATPNAQSWEPFDPRVLDFLTALSGAIRGSRLSLSEDVAAFGFWCRRAHLVSLRKRHSSVSARLGRGLIFHVAPSNVPAMFAYSLAIGMLAGNANLVRLSSRCGALEQSLCSLIDEVLNRPEHTELHVRTALVSYGRDDARTAALLAGCDGRMVWGGDETVAALRAIPMSPLAIELSFPDRWSLALFSSKTIADCDAEELAGLARRFYNDTYLMDQNACSSPRLLLWLEDGDAAMSQRRWWDAVAIEVERRYQITAFQAARKYEDLCFGAMNGTVQGRLTRYHGNLLYVVDLTEMPHDLTVLQGRFGLFYESRVSALEDLLPFLHPKMQTLVCLGPDPNAVAKFLAQHHARGIDRVVALGQALEIDTVWDGTDLIAALSRVIWTGGVANGAIRGHKPRVHIGDK